MSAKQFLVEYIDKQGNRHKEVVFATDTEQIRSNFTNEGKIIVNIQRSYRFSFKRDIKKLVVFMKNLTYLMEGGYSIGKALQILKDNEEDATFRNVINDILDAVNSGFSITEAFSTHKEWFSHSVRAMIQAAEESGNLITVFKEIVNFLEAESEKRKEMQSKMRSNIILLFAGVGILYFNVFITIPKIMKSGFFQSMIKKNTGFSFQLIHLTTKFMPLISLGLFLCIVAIVITYRLKQEEIEAYLERIPLFNRLIFTKESFLLYFALAKLLKVNVKVDQAFKIVARNTKLYRLKNAFLAAAQCVERGESFVDALPCLDGNERALLAGTTTLERLAFNMDLIALKKGEDYQEAINKLPIVAKMFVYCVLGYIFFLLFVGVLLPYYKTIAEMMDKL